MVELIVKDIVSNYSDNKLGLMLLDEIKESFSSNKNVNVSFGSIPYVSSSFVNSAFINLLSDYSFEYIKQHLKFTNSNVQINLLITDRFKFETSKETVA